VPQFNFRSVGGKSAALCENIHSDDADIFVVTETWHQPNDNVIVNAITPVGYGCIHRARPIPRNTDTTTLYSKTMAA